MLLKNTKCCLLKYVGLIGYLFTEVSEESAAFRGRKEEASGSQTLTPAQVTCTTPYPSREGNNVPNHFCKNSDLTLWVKGGTFLLKEYFLSWLW
jgi:hypothetical protein